MGQNGDYDGTRLNHWSSRERFRVRVSRRSESHEKLIRKEGAARGFLPSKSSGSSPEDDAELLYIHKTVSIEMMSRKSDQELVHGKERQDISPYSRNDKHPDDEMQIMDVARKHR
jgi:hypothetical protein